jgi:hypothetical protein
VSNRRRILIAVGIISAAALAAALLVMPFPKPLTFTVQIPPATRAGR